MIFSKKFVTEKNKESLKRFQDGKISSYMTKKAYDLLSELKEKCTVIPCTTRSQEQFARVDPFFDCEYAICANGAIILHNGTVNRQWEMVMKKNLDYCKNDLMLTKARIESSDFLKSKVKFVNDFFLFFRTTDIEKCKQFMTDYVKKDKFYWSITGRKCYIFPNPVRKDHALRYLRDTIGDNDLFVSGDGELDIGMLQLANVERDYIVHSSPDIEYLDTLNKLGLDNGKTIVLNKMGVMAGECVLSRVKKILDKEEKEND